MRCAETPGREAIRPVAHPILGLIRRASIERAPF